MKGFYLIKELELFRRIVGSFKRVLNKGMIIRCLFFSGISDCNVEKEWIKDETKDILCLDY